MDGNYQNKQQEEEIFDEELQAMGLNYTDESAGNPIPQQMPRMERTVAKSTAHKSTGRSENPGEAMDASWAPVRSKKACLRDRLLGCTKWVGICGGISMLLWWFQINDLMAMQAAYPCIVACGILGGFGVGMHVMR